MLRPVEIEHFACNDFKISLGPTMPAAQVAAVKPNSDRGGCGIGLGKRDSHWRQPRDLHTNAPGSISDRARVYRAADGQQICEQTGRSCKRRDDGGLGGYVSKLGRHAAFQRQRGEALWSFPSPGHRQPTKRRTRSGTSPNRDRNVMLRYPLLGRADRQCPQYRKCSPITEARARTISR